MHFTLHALFSSFVFISLSMFIIPFHHSFLYFNSVPYFPISLISFYSLLPSTFCKIQKIFLYRNYSKDKYMSGFKLSSIVHMYVGGLCTVHFEKFLFTNFSEQFTTSLLLYTRDSMHLSQNLFYFLLVNGSSAFFFLFLISLFLLISL